MKSQTSLAARNCRLQEWSQMVHSCNNRPIGMSVMNGVGKIPLPQPTTIIA